MKKKLSDIVFQRISPPDHKLDLGPDDMSNVLVRRLGLKRKVSRANHSKLLLEMIRLKRDNMPLSIDQISQILGVSQSQTYEEIRKWRTLGLIEFIKIPSGEGFAKGYLLTAPTVNRLLDRVEASTKSFFRKTRRIAKDFDDLLMLASARGDKAAKANEESKEAEDKIIEADKDADTLDEEN